MLSRIASLTSAAVASFLAAVLSFTDLLQSEYEVSVKGRSERAITLGRLGRNVKGETLIKSSRALLKGRAAIAPKQASERNKRALHLDQRSHRTLLC